MAALTGDQLTMMLKTIHDAGNANATAIATLFQSIETVRNQSTMAERAWQVAHEELHARIHGLQLEAQQSSSGSAPYRRSLIDPKTLIPDAFSGEPKTQSWRDWSYRLKSFVGSLQPKLHNAMERTEHKTTPVLEADFTNLGIDPGTVNELKAMLTQKTQGYAHTIIRQHDLSNGLEVYRCLAQHFEPDTNARNLDDLRQILHPVPATSMEDFARKYPAWKALYQTRFNRIGDEARLTDDIRLTIWMDLLPPRERDDVTRHRHFWKDSDALDRHLLQLISDRTRGATTHLAHVEQEDDFDDLESLLDPDTGDTHLFRVEPKTGKKHFVKTRRFNQHRGERKCYRCGRGGHMAADCHAKSHIDGGPPRAPRLPPRQAGIVEDDQVNINSRPMAPYTAVTVEPGTSDLGICDICGLESEEDLWKGGNDPWSSSAALLTVPPRSASEEEVAQPGYPGAPLLQKRTQTFPTISSTVECSICRKDGVYDRYEQNLRCHNLQSQFPVQFDVDICAVSIDKTFVGRRLSADITVDSGAGKSVMNPDAVPEYMLQESQGQIQGQHFLGAGGERLPNMGQKCVPLMTADGVSRLATFQITPVRKPLLAVSASCDAGQMCVFDNDGSYIIERESPEGREIRRLAKQCVAKMTLERKNGVYTLPTWVVPPERLTPEARNRTKPVARNRPASPNDMEVDSGFARPGR